MSLVFYSTKMGNLSEILTIINCNPIWTGILGAIIYKESFGLVEIFSSVFGILGILFIFKPPFIMNLLKDFG